MLARPWFLVALAVAAGCGGEGGEANTENSAVLPADSASAAPSTDSSGWRVTPAGMGPLTIGMIPAAIHPYLAPGTPIPGAVESCEYVTIPSAPDSVLFMIADGRLARIDVTGGATATLEGARIGDPESRILELYPQAVSSPHKYTDGAYLSVQPGAGDTLHRYLFETDGRVVTRYRAGALPQVEWVEGCA